MKYTGQNHPTGGVYTGWNITFCEIKHVVPILLQVNKILKVIPRERKTYLFSATMTKKVQKLQRASLHDPVKVEVSTKWVLCSFPLVAADHSPLRCRYQTVEKLLQNYLFIPSKYKDCYLVSILNELAGNSVMVFCGTCSNAQRYFSSFPYAPDL